MLQDARDAWECCHAIQDPEAKEACYAQFGTDAKRVEQYLQVVEQVRQWRGRTRLLRRIHPLCFAQFPWLDVIVAIVSAFGTFLPVVRFVKDSSSYR